MDRATSPHGHRGGGPETDPAAAAIADWQRAEERLYPLVMVDPNGYTRLVSVIRAAADLLAAHQTTEELIAARSQGREIVGRAARAIGVDVTQIVDVELVADAAFGLRHREATNARRSRERAERIATARRDGHQWVIVRESGHVDRPAVQPYERIEMDLSDGRGLRASVDIDPSLFRPVYLLEEVRLDPTTGTVIEDPRPETAQTFTQREPWETARRRWRSKRSQLP